MFVIQACRGTMYQQGVERLDDDPCWPEEITDNLTTPQDADILIAYSTVPGKKYYMLILDRIRISAISARGLILLWYGLKQVLNVLLIGYSHVIEMNKFIVN